MLPILQYKTVCVTCHTFVHWSELSLATISNCRPTVVTPLEWQTIGKISHFAKESKIILIMKIRNLMGRQFWHSNWFVVGGQDHYKPVEHSWQQSNRLAWKFNGWIDASSVKANFGYYWLLRWAIERSPHESSADFQPLPRSRNTTVRVTALHWPLRVKRSEVGG